MKRPYVPTSKPTTTGGTIAVTFENGVTAILPAYTACWDTFEPDPIRKLFGLPPIDECDLPRTITLAEVQQESNRPWVSIRSEPGFKGTGYASVELESKNERIARLEASLAHCKSALDESRVDINEILRKDGDDGEE